MHIIGIDPGLNGGFGVISDDRVFGTTIPTYWEVLKSGKRRKQYDLVNIRRLLIAQQSISKIQVILEKQIPMPILREIKTGVVKQGAVSIFSTGFGYGAFLGILCGLDITTDEVHPKTWQSEFNIHTTEEHTTKEAALEAVQHIYPDVNLYASERAQNAHSGIVDGILIAEWYRRKLKGILRK